MDRLALFAFAFWLIPFVAGADEPAPAPSPEAPVATDAPQPPPTKKIGIRVDSKHPPKLDIDTIRKPLWRRARKVSA
jgi:hypothetical protein